MNIPEIQFLDGGTGLNFEQLFGHIMEKCHREFVEEYGEYYISAKSIASEEMADKILLNIPEIHFNLGHCYYIKEKSEYLLSCKKEKGISKK